MVLFSPCLFVCVSVCPANIVVFFISRLLEEISEIYTGYLSGCTQFTKKIDLHRSKVKVTGTVHCFLKVQSYHKLSHRKISFFFFHIHLSEQRNDVTKKYVNI